MLSCLHCPSCMPIIPITLGRLVPDMESHGLEQSILLLTKSMRMVRRQTSSSDTSLTRLVGTSPAIIALRSQIQQLVRFDAPGYTAVPTLLLQGETGTGKSLVARVVHDSGPRAGGPFLEVNCAALPETMLEAELFGFEAGAFTDAKRAKPGLFEAAVGGTLFLDEIDAVPLALQGKLLTAIERKQVRRLGALAERAVDVKLIAATNADLGQQLSTGQFRTDLYHRLAVVVLTLPPLRQRGEDILVLAETLLTQLAATHGLPPKRLQADAVTWLQHYPWPGNVRELGHLLERVTLLHPAEVVTAATLAHWCAALPNVVPAPGVPLAPDLSPPAESPATPVATEAQEIATVLGQTGGNLAQAARLLGMSRDQLRSRMRHYGLTRPALPARLPASPSVTMTVGSPEVSPSAQAVAVVPTPASSRSEGAALPLPMGERRQLTVLFADLAGSTALASALDPEAWQALLHAYHTICAAVMTRYAGHIAQYLGDGVLVYFGYPQAQEDDARRAVQAALALVEALHQPAGAPWEPGAAPAARASGVAHWTGSHRRPRGRRDTRHIGPGRDAACRRSLARGGHP